MQLVRTSYTNQCDSLSSLLLVTNWSRAKFYEAHAPILNDIEHMFQDFLGIPWLYVLDLRCHPQAAIWANVISICRGYIVDGFTQRIEIHLQIPVLANWMQMFPESCARGIEGCNGLKFVGAIPFNRVTIDKHDQTYLWQPWQPMAMAWWQSSA